MSESQTTKTQETFINVDTRSTDTVVVVDEVGEVLPGPGGRQLLQLLSDRVQESVDVARRSVWRFRRPGFGVKLFSVVTDGGRNSECFFPANLIIATELTRNN
jgi:hypothetical protein